MPDLQTEAIVLRRADYRDADRMLTLFSPDHGRLDVCARGIRKTASKLKAACEPFATGTYQLHAAGDRMALTGFFLTEGFFPLRGDFERLTQASYALAVCGSVVQPDKPDPGLFALLQLTLGRLAYSDINGANLLTGFLLAFASREGFAPSLNACVKCGAIVDGHARFSHDGGGVCHDACVPYAFRISSGALAYMRRVQSSLDATDADSRADVSEALAVARRFVESRLGGRIKAGEMLTW